MFMREIICMEPPRTYPDMNSYSVLLADRLRNLRNSLNLSQEAVAHAAGISVYTYQKFEKGESSPGTPMNPRLHTLLALAEVFHLSVSDLLDLDKT